jgi:hypothetical protein
MIMIAIETGWNDRNIWWICQDSHFSRFFHVRLSRTWVGKIERSRWQTNLFRSVDPSKLCISASDRQILHREANVPELPEVITFSQNYLVEWDALNRIDDMIYRGLKKWLCPIPRSRNQKLVLFLLWWDLVVNTFVLSNPSHPLHPFVKSRP